MIMAYSARTYTTLDGPIVITVTYRWLRAGKSYRFSSKVFRTSLLCSEPQPELQTQTEQEHHDWNLRQFR